MAKNTIPGLKTGGGILSKAIGTVVVLAILVVVVKYPSDAASLVKTVFAGLGTLIDGLVSFFRALIG
jgi:hypothetical protein